MPLIPSPFRDFDNYVNLNLIRGQITTPTLPPLRCSDLPTGMQLGIIKKVWLSKAMPGSPIDAFQIKHVLETLNCTTTRVLISIHTTQNSQNKWTKISGLKTNIFELKMMVKSGLEFFILKFYQPLQSCCCPVQKKLPGKAELAWQVSR